MVESRQRHRTPGQAATAQPQKRSIACYRCHSQKSKCSGEKPCSRCRRTGYAAQCRYADRDRKVRVGEKYLEQLIEDSRQLHALQNGESQHNTCEDTADTADIKQRESSPPTTQNYTGEASWFQSEDASVLPIYTSGASCLVFASQLCQCLKTTDSPALHIPRWNYTDESTLNLALHTDINWPSAPYAHLLVKTALGHINPAFHLALKKDTVDVLSSVYQKESFDDSILKCKYFALFAIGQVYSMSNSPGNTSYIPGTGYFARSLDLIQVIPERPSMLHIESLLLLAYFCQFLNRFHSAYMLIGNALRLGLSAGLNHNIPRSQNISAKDREHRVRIWWSIYILDRFWGSKSGFPVQIHDDDIHVDLPSTQINDGQFSESAYQTATIELARMTGNTTKEIYGKRKHDECFLQREQRLLTQLKTWVEALPEHLKLKPDTANPKHTVLMHLQFSFIVTLTIRPVLLNLLTRNLKKRPSFRNDVTPVLTTLGEACIQVARYSLKLCQDEWTSGSIAIFGYAFPVFIFSSSLVLIGSSLLPIGSTGDLASAETGIEMLRVFSESNNLAAKDLHGKLHFVREWLENYRNSTENAQNHQLNPPVMQHDDCCVSNHNPPADGFPINPAEPSTFPNLDMSASMALQSSTMEEFLTQPVSIAGPTDMGEFPLDFDSTFLWFDDASITG